MDGCGAVDELLSELLDRRGTVKQVRFRRQRRELGTDFVKLTAEICQLGGRLCQVDGGLVLGRDAPPLDALGELAADLQRQMTEHMVGEARKLLAIDPLPTRICFDGGDEARMRAWLGLEEGADG